jgi:hypothetical protein
MMQFSAFKATQDIAQEKPQKFTILGYTLNLVWWLHHYIANTTHWMW